MKRILIAGGGWAVIYESVKETHHKNIYVFLLLLVIFFIAISYFSPIYFFVVDMVMIFVILTGRCKNEIH